MVIETRAGVTIHVLNENVQRLQQQIDNHTGSIDQLHERVDGIEASLTVLRAISLIINSHFLISEFYQQSSWDHQMELAHPPTTHHLFC
jgi:folate-dependent phosphoribosylglycinamide formyltransferase PurN